MELVTHVLLGANVAHACAPRRGVLAPRRRLLLGGAAAACPDVDFVGFAVDAQRFLADWHQGPTHSLLLLPAWALVVAVVYVAAFGERGHRRRLLPDAAWTAAVAIASHVAADAITAYGAMLAYPLSSQRTGSAWTFVVDPLFTAIVLVAAVAAWRSPRRGAVVLALAVLGGYVALQAQAQQRALAAGAASAREQGVGFERLRAFAQPLSPLNWRLVASAGDRHAVAHVNVAGHGAWLPAWLPLGPLHALAAAYRAPGDLHWQWRELDRGDALVRSSWRDQRLAPFRRFATHPALERVDTGADGVVRCVWFTDLRYDLPALPATFRYGLCRDAEGAPWHPYRLRYFSADARQRLPRRRRRALRTQCAR